MILPRQWVRKRFENYRIESAIAAGRVPFILKFPMQIEPGILRRNGKQAVWSKKAKKLARLL